ncbi:MAG: LysR family transcriptional regulator [Oscillospiraceae bacterium]
MTLRHLRVFIAVAENGKMSAAAEKLYIAQPSVSQAIAEIEEQYGGKLFERLSRKLYLTPLGEQLLGYARHIISLYDEMDTQLKNSASAAILKIGATVTVGTCVICPILNKLKSVNPELTAHVQIGNTRDIEEKLMRSELDIGLVEGKVKSSDLIYEPVISDELLLVCSPKHRLSACSSVIAQNLSSEPMVIREKGSGTRELFENYLLLHGIHINESWVCNNSEAIKNAVIDNQGLTVISRRLVAKELSRKTLVSIPIKDGIMSREFSLVYHKNKYLTPSIEEFICICREFEKSNPSGSV